MFKPQDRVVCVRYSENLELNRVYTVDYTSKITTGTKVYDSVNIVGINRCSFSPEFFVGLPEFRKMKIVKIREKSNG